MKLILASNSPRRQELIKLLDLNYESISPNIEEVNDPSLTHEELVMDLAFQKALAVFKNRKNDLVLGFDTLVIIDDLILGKPKNEEEAKFFLQTLSGKTHRVLTGCAIIKKGYSKSFYTQSLVTFWDLTESEIEEYIKTKEPMDKAGAYGIQDHGARFVKSISGDYFTIVGFPVSRVYQELKKVL
ncbi:MAG: Maf family protein [Candidatus Izemoplasmatales bacterium]|nr:Maf family protein [Candidatus Izemoplasmatales bacterium]MDY0138241.1 Maf family protein [Candidatus Izemoplasmatales bacterium]